MTAKDWDPPAAGVSIMSTTTATVVGSVESAEGGTNDDGSATTAADQPSETASDRAVPVRAVSEVTMVDVVSVDAEDAFRLEQVGDDVSSVGRPCELAEVTTEPFATAAPSTNFGCYNFRIPLLPLLKSRQAPLQIVNDDRAHTQRQTHLLEDAPAVPERHANLVCAGAEDSLGWDYHYYHHNDSDSDNDRDENDADESDHEDFGEDDRVNGSSRGSSSRTLFSSCLSSKNNSVGNSNSRKTQRWNCHYGNPSVSMLPNASSSSSVSSSTSTSSAAAAVTSQSQSQTWSGCVSGPLSKSSSWSKLLERELVYTNEELSMADGDLPTDRSNLHPSQLSAPRNYWIVTTAALPWMTGTAVNPLLRAANLSQFNRNYLQNQHKRNIRSTDGNNADADADIVTTTPTSTVTLVLPWLESSEDRVALYGPEWQHASPQDQDAYIRKWLRESAGLPLEADLSQGGIVIEWYTARYHATLSSIFAMGDLCQRIPTQNHMPNTICILEEPEHVNFYRSPGRHSWRDKFQHVIGIIHTNYKAYARSHYSGLVIGPLIGALSSLMVRAYCDKVIKLSPVLQTYAPEKEVVCNVHGIRNEFFQKSPPTGSKIYFIGKLLWAKGLDKLLQLQAQYKRRTGSYFPIDIYGSGPEQDDIQRAFLKPHIKRTTKIVAQNVSNKNRSQSTSESHLLFSDPSGDTVSITNDSNFTGVTTDASAATKASSSSLAPSPSLPSIITTSAWFSTASSLRSHPPIPAIFCGRKDHAAIDSDYKIFVNPSITEVLCTTTAESIAMGKWVIIPKHPSNEFFAQFSNCLQYTCRQEFVDYLLYALQEPVPVHSNYDPLTWTAATERFIESGSISRRDAKRRDRIGMELDEVMQKIHYTLGRGHRGDVLRKVFGGGPVAEQHRYELSAASGAA